jgi:hypothetical protein
MPQSMVGLLAAVATAMPVLVAYAHGALVWVMIAAAATAAGLAASSTAPPSKKTLWVLLSGYRLNWVRMGSERRHYVRIDVRGLACLTPARPPDKCR